MNFFSRTRVLFAVMTLTLAAHYSFAQSHREASALGAEAVAIDPGSPALSALPSLPSNGLPDAALHSNVFGTVREVTKTVPMSDRVLWIVSSLALSAAEAADLGTSVGRNEANPLLQNSAGRIAVGRAVGIKVSLSGAMILVQAALARRNPSVYRSSAIINFLGAGVIGGVAAHNATTR